MIISDKARYVITSVLVSILSLARNLIFLKTFGLADLGQVALMQTIVMMIGLTQGGMINGGYRIYAVGNSSQNKTINNTIFTFFAGLLLIILALGGISQISLGLQAVQPTTLYIGLASGIATLASTWINNALIGDGNLRKSNAINGLAVACSCAIGALAWRYGLIAALISMLIQPLIVTAIGILWVPHLRPTSCQFKRETVNSILARGFIPFAAGIFVVLNQQLDRWAINNYLGTESLGRFYLVILYSSIFTLVPISLLNLHFPRAVRAYSENRINDFKNIAKRHATDLCVYLVIACLLTFLCLPSVMATLFSNYAEDTHLIFFAMPALVVATLCDPASMFLDAVKRLRHLLLAGFYGLCSSTAMILIAQKTGIFSVETGIFIRTAAASVTLIYLLHTARASYLEITKFPTTS